MTTLKLVNLILSSVILLLGIVTILRFAVLVWQKKTPENVAKFRRLAIEFAILAGSSVILQVITAYLRSRFLRGGY